MQYRRAVAVEHLDYDENGLMKPIVQTREGVSIEPCVEGTPTRDAFKPAG